MLSLNALVIFAGVYLLDAGLFYYNLVNTPLYFVHSGSVNIYNDWLDHLGDSGIYWARTATSRHWSGRELQCALSFGINQDVLFPNNASDGRQFGHPLRCLVCGGETRTNDNLGHLKGRFR